MKKFVIAMVGPQLSGKSKFVEAIADWCGRDRVGLHGTGDILRGILGTFNLPQDRPHCDKLVGAMIEYCGPDWLANAIKNRIQGDARPVVIFDSMRLLVDEQMVVDLPHQVLRVYITAPAHVRYRRLMERKRHGEEQLSFEEFCKNDNLPMERLIHAIGSRAQVKLETSDDYAHNDRLRLQFCQEYLVQHRQK